jgi:UDP-N-acetylglucosamine--N-acetylmuramyl-(pentapeptide) pyrophosphoryl-undecaprenol N-acetylglucosamine transferase
MWSNEQPLKVIISGGGTGGHIFPALAIAKEIRKRMPDSQILFVGAKGRMEMEKVPMEGFEIVGLNISGLQRKLSLKNVAVPVKLAGSLVKAWRIVRSFKPHVAVGVGGYASAPLLFAASLLGVPTLIQEQNSYAGLTNKLLARKANIICVAYHGMDKYFPAAKIKWLGNPVREDIAQSTLSKADACNHFDLLSEKPVLLVIGGSLGARTINESIVNGLQKLLDQDVQLIWQTGKAFAEQAQAATAGNAMVWTNSFISNMAMAYAAADVVVSRAGALSVSEICLVGKPAVFVPSPNVAEDHQTKNARSLVDAEAALMVSDKEAGKKLVDTAIALLNDSSLQNKVVTNIKKLARPEATHHIVNEILTLAKHG